MRNTQLGGPDVLRFQLPGKCVNGVVAACHHGQCRCIAACDLDASRQQRPQRVGAGAHGQHRTARLIEHRLPACEHRGHRVLQREHAGMAGGRVLADAVADHGVGMKAKAVEPRGQRIRHAEQRRLCIAGLRK